ncbi:MAG TPA: dihydroorotate dehydrogenase-like protein [Armatimonadota bacterium]|nr:dihydroorotate dehydrogenase-like protein [Armatimonadota bacterium]HPO73907.1 dihydroorotate dehydrogenase-like protein [Armatimonadota bacterium]HPT99451.1 dihydroorotate dehydrogenase-like protein [Armatimonadota bacterium]
MDLSTRYLGLTLKNPIIPSASPLTRTVDRIQELEDAGAAAVVMPSLFEEQITLESLQLDHYLAYGSESHPEALSYIPEPASFQFDPDTYLETIRKAKESVHIPVIASLNGTSPGGWMGYARLMEEAGADALELNIYYIPTDPLVSGAQVEQMYFDVLREVRQSVKIPIAVKLGPYFSAIAFMARRLAEAGANGLVFFNRFYQPDIDLEKLEVTPDLVLSTSTAMRLPLRWVAILYGRVNADFAITNGVHTHEDVLKATMAGASATQIAAELLEKGPGRIPELLAEITRWMEQHEYHSLAQLRGSMSQKNVADPGAFERANYMRVLQSWRQDPTGCLL